MLEALQPLINSASIDTLQTLSSALPRHSMLLGPISLALTTTLVARLRDATIANRDAHLPALAGSVNNLAVDLAEVGRRGEALTAAQEAADLYRELVALNRDAYLPALAASVNNLAVRLGEVGRRGEALTAAQEAADLYQELAQIYPDVFNPEGERARSLVAELSIDPP
jgi:tetratricopeptide (TPR) repeat protein